MKEFPSSAAIEAEEDEAGRTIATDLVLLLAPPTGNPLDTRPTLPEHLNASPCDFVVQYVAPCLAKTPR